MTDRNTEYMREMWGTTRLITDYNSMNELREVTHDSKNKKVKTEDKELFSTESSWDYGIEPAILNG